MDDFLFNAARPFDDQLVQVFHTFTARAGAHPIILFEVLVAASVLVMTRKYAKL